MNILSNIGQWLRAFLKTRAEEEFGIKPITATDMLSFIEYCSHIYEGNPEWMTSDIGTINFAKAICSETARLATLGLGVKFDGAKSDFLQDKFDKEVFYNLRHWIEYGLAFGTIILKPNGDSVDIITPDKFCVTETENGKITGVIFDNQLYDADSEKWYTRLEYHRFEDGKYTISNRCTISNDKNSKGKQIDIKDTPWKDLAEDIVAENVDRPLFGVFRTPAANNIDIDSPYGMPIFADAITELRDLDVAYSRNAEEIFDSSRILMLDGDVMSPSGAPITAANTNYNTYLTQLGLPKYVRSLYGNGDGNLYHEINPEMRTEQRLVGINALLSQIGYKCGFSNGYFVFNEREGVATATQIEAEQQRTIQLIKDIRDKIEDCLDGLIYAMSKFADAYDLEPIGEFETTYDFGDITYNVDEDRARWYSYVVAQKIPFWYFLTKFEGMSEEDAKALEAEATPKEIMFGTEE